MISRAISNSIEKHLKDEKAIILLGPRQVGKSTLLQQLSSKFEAPIIWWNGDDADIRTILSNTTSTALRSLLGKAKTLIIDEAQRIDNIGLSIKLIIDQLKDVKVIATGSSAFELANHINEPLTGRKWEYNLFPFSFGEMVEEHGLLTEKRLLNHRLVYGYYPEIVNNQGEEESRLKQLSDSYLYKDILTWEKIQKPDKMEKLIQALAFQVGNEVSYHELGQITGLDNQTTEKYIDLLEKAFIVFRLGSLSRNLRNELKKSRKIYFYDNGIRNAVINQFSPATLRQDIGALWENFVISERVKFLAYRQINCNKYFWRTHAQQEIDYIEERNGVMSAYEIKWNSKSKAKFPKTFLDAYKEVETKIITPDNISEFLL
ncbi:ATP-binding protein [Pedobacter fastidiosus]|uniref:ATP-binding protein n=1 Tax=Pedobacter fastidiosus TaxID=2765361 RepID=A0ABR7KTM5_9SPHI|nr:ATP-binding protein [Pedobacter fastidiosus]MBC6111464.1 ATP-binding protein [Pedobacter fastidiosus]